MSLKRYRRDVDGLRAIAVLLVIGYHAFPRWVCGGFVGVDVFFVISGFLISDIIFRKLEGEQFSFVEFYSRRIRRIFPALLIVLFTCLGLGIFFLFADEYSLLGKHTMAAAAFLSNFVLNGEVGYFDKAAELKPLLHLWSLGVEEQFYIFWPLMLFLSWKKRIPFIYTIIVIGGISFGLNIHRIYQHTHEVFLLPHTRIWELLAGSTLAYFNERKPLMTILPIDANIKAFFGVLLICLGTIFLNDKSYFPGFGALLPVIGSFLLLSAGEDAWFNRKILSHKFLVGIGLISYPLYLWHWPLFSFLRIVDLEYVSTIIAAIALSFLLSWLTYEFLEKPIRHSKQALSLLCTMAVVGLVGFYIYFNNGAVTKRLAKSAELIQSLESFRIASKLVSSKFCLPQVLNALWCHADNREKPKYLILGDSQSEALFPGLVVKSEAGERWVNANQPGLMFLDGLTWKDKTIVAHNYEAAVQALVDSDVKLALFVNSLRVLENDDFFLDTLDAKAYVKSRLEGFSETISRFEKTGKQVVFMIPTPWFHGIDPKACLIKRPLRGLPKLCSKSLVEHEAELTRFRKMYAQLKVQHPKMQIYDPTPVLCPNGTCGVLMDGRPVYKDDNHVSDFGAELIAQDFLNKLHFRN